MKKALMIVGLVAAAAVAWWLLSPLFLSETVVEDFPMSAAATLPARMAQADAEATMVAAASVDEPLDEAMPAALPESAAEPAAIKHGAFHDADDVHHGSGTATIYALPDGSHVLRLDDLDVTNGPDLFVVVSPHPDPTNGDELHAEGYATLEGLKGNKGSQNYTIPADLDVAVQQSVAIYCRAFGVLFAVAPLEQAQITQ